MAERMRVTLTVNDTQVEREIPVRLTLADFLRHELGLTGTHLGCEHGVCGACTVLVDGRTARGCLMLAVQADGASVRTIEGMADGGALSPLQQAFVDHHGLQCGFCTPGVLATLSELLATRPDADEDEIRAWLSGNICRCTGYQGIVDAALAAAKAVRDGRQGA
jgi:carbon-monoxide dehydrogenase small subunit